jgi:hypothetical protein
MRGELLATATRLVRQQLVRLNDPRSLPTVVVVLQDVITFTVIVLAAAGTDWLLERIRGSVGFFDDIRLVANLLLGFVSIVYLVEAALLVIIDVTRTVKIRWETELEPSIDPVAAAASEISGDDS